MSSREMADEIWLKNEERIQEVDGWSKSPGTDIE
jgi:hypothetical protein